MAELAVLELYHSRPFAPTRRLALSTCTLPVDPAPGSGGVLLGAVMAQFRGELDDEMYENLHTLSMQVQEGQRIVQPRARHRFQDDQHGLTRSRAALVRHGEGLGLRLENKSTGLQMMLGAIYAAGRLPAAARRTVMDAVRKGMRWTGTIDRSLFAHLSGLDSGRDWSASAYEDPVQWALATLGMGASRTGAVLLPDRKQIQRRFRDALRDAHPDHGAAHEAAAERINDLTEARRILLS